MIINRKKIQFVIAVFILVTWPYMVWADMAGRKYVLAETAYKKLKSDPGLRKYRDQWLRCIEKFQGVYRVDPSGKWASAGMYMSGKIYGELYRYSGKQSDLKEALDIFERIIKRFPKSAYSEKAKKDLWGLRKKYARQLKNTPPPSLKKSKKRPVDNNTVKRNYITAEKCYDKLRKNTARKKYRDVWFKCIDKYRKVYRLDPEGPWAPAALYKSGRLYRELYRYSYKKSDDRKAAEYFKRIIKKFPESRYQPMAAKEIGLPEKTVSSKTALKKKKVPQKKEENVRADAIADKIKALADDKSLPAKEVPVPVGGRSTITGLRYWSNPSYTRVVIDADSNIKYEQRLLKKDPSINKPQRLFVDLFNARIKDGVTKTIPINDHLLSDARAAQHSVDSVRVVIDIKSFKTYKIFSLRNPFRIVIDMWGKAGKPASPARQAVKTTLGKNGKLTTSALAKQLALGVSRIVIDPGHGGRDRGASGYFKGVYEKNIALALSRKLAKKIRKELKCEVVLTRTRDTYLTLEERTAIANTKNADLFISIHTNAARDRRAYGIETFFLNLATDNDAILVAARENATSTKNISDLQTILSDLMQNAKINESSRLATHVQGELYRHMKKNYSRIKNKGVKQAPFYVLLGAQMPSILIETAFISNSRECKRLGSAKYQDYLCDGIIKGIRSYIKETSPAALNRSMSGSRLGG